MRKLLAALVVAAFAAAASAQPYPDRPIKLVNPWSPGGPTDLVARPIAEKLAAALGQPVVLENMPGANGEIGTAAVAKAAPDGYTLLFSTSSSIALGPALHRVPYDPVADFAPITQAVSGAQILLVRPDLPIHSVSELVAWARAHPGRLSYGSAGAGGTTHLCGVLLAQLAGIELLHVPYKGAAPALNDLLGGQIDIVFVNAASALPHMRAGKLRGIAVSSAHRVPLLPDLPTIAETLPGFEVDSWYGFMAPRGTPPEIVQRLYAEIARILRMPDIEARLRQAALQPVGTAPREHAEMIRSEIARWQAVAREAGLHSD